MSRPVVAFVCTHNSCRSQLAEALGRLLAADVFESCSAGTAPKSAINPDAVRVLRRLCGVDMRQEDWAKAESLRAAYEDLLQKALAAGDPAAPDAQEACRLHGQWLRLFWREGSYSRAAQAALGEGYASDERFRAYYEKLGPGCADFFRDALAVYARS